MIVPGEVREVAGPIEFPLAAPVPAAEGTKVGPKPAAACPEQNAAMAPLEINLSGAQILAGLASALSFVAVVLWALIKLWLFEQ